MNCPHCAKLADTLYCNHCGRFTTGLRLFTEAEVRAAVEGEIEHQRRMYDEEPERVCEAKYVGQRILARLGLNK